MSPTHSLDNIIFNYFTTKYSNTYFYNGFAYGFIAGVSTTILVFSLFHHNNSCALNNRIVLL